MMNDDKQRQMTGGVDEQQVVLTNDGWCWWTTGGDDEWWVAGPDDATHIVWAFGMFFIISVTYIFTKYIAWQWMIKWMMAATTDDWWRQHMMTTDEGTMGRRPRRCKSHCLGLQYVSFFSICIPTCYIKYNIWMYTCKKKVGPNQLRLIMVWLQLNRLRPVEKLIETGMDRSLVVPVQFLDFLRIGKPVPVVVAPKKGKKPDRTGL